MVRFGPDILLPRGRQRANSTSGTSLLLEPRGVVFELGSPGRTYEGPRTFGALSGEDRAPSQRGAPGCCPRYDSASIHPRWRRPLSLGWRPRLSCRIYRETNPPDIITML